MTIVFISKDGEEFKRYVTCPLEDKRESELKDIGFAYSIEGGQYEIIVLNGERMCEKKILSESSFAQKDVPPFVNRFSSVLINDLNVKNYSDGGSAFIHWGGGRGTVTDVEELARESLERTECWRKAFPKWSVYALSSRRPSLLDVMRTPIPLPRTAIEVRDLIDKAEGDTLFDFWFRCVNELDEEDCAVRVRAKKYMENLERKILESSLPEKDKGKHLDGVCEVICCLNGKRMSMTPKAKLFISRFLGKEYRYV